ncbi:branched-chain-amino-acid aminotransferase-like protein 1 [Phtheirospermum japonicum]|uniref:Branched-chain-amino-acid aminotransferase-like protein 1 n=1 Tax=Phtheirospermum japonicum TaxID=374723 RepID=A0A830C296_9LAMI|nr:branched-chain-amino-acid aminotransferase-like protein 1 [Phtheirospermum japonicum]
MIINATTIYKRKLKKPSLFPKPFPSSLYNLLEQCLPFYNLLKRHVRQNAAKSFHPPLPVPANEKLLAWVDDEILPRDSATVSVFDSVVQGGDAVWEGLRIYEGKIFKLEEHLDRRECQKRGEGEMNMRQQTCCDFIIKSQQVCCHVLVHLPFSALLSLLGFGSTSCLHGLKRGTRHCHLTHEIYTRMWLFDSSKALAFSNVPTREEVKQAIFKTLIRNGMFNNAHIRLTLTRGKKVTSGMSPAFNLYGCTLIGKMHPPQLPAFGSSCETPLVCSNEPLTSSASFYTSIVLAEWKPPVYDNESGVTLVTATTRRNSPNNLDSKIHHNNLLNNILAKVEGNNSHADDAIMLDKDGYVSETNATNIFLVKKGHVATPHPDYCLPGITRATVMELVVKEKLVLTERRISLSEFHTADEVFTTGTMGELSPQGPHEQGAFNW